ncbi:hypothetical protein [Leyella stercorea]|jgi:hypothetical protein|uniref:hypothetical protein n=1 Tax=Leyella stercorea TaxID=363265 RepID=UPI00266EA7EE|nr:hypothetical protein [Leyella stercorea]
MDDYIYGIIKENGVNRLRKVSYPIKELFSISDYELCKSHKYATCFNSTYSDSLCSIDVKQLASSENERNKRKAAVCFEHSIKEFEERYGDRIVAMSHRRGGWYGINWKFNDDISFNINTNFGFGSCSYFYAIFMYKDIILAPYSFYIKYKNSTFASVTRCTYQYSLEYKSWDSVMTDCLNFYDAIVKKNYNYVFTWLDKQLNEMVSGLERLIDRSSAGFWDESINKSHASKFAIITGDDFWFVKSKKIAYSLDFISNISSLPVEIDTALYTKRILLLCKKFQPKLIVKIEEVSKLYNIQLNKLSKLKESEDYPLYYKLYKKYYHKRRWYKSSFKMIYFLLHLKERINLTLSCKEIRIRIAKLKKLKENISNLESEMNSTKYLLDQLNEDNNNINNYFENIEV